MKLNKKKLRQIPVWPATEDLVRLAIRTPQPDWFVCAWHHQFTPEKEVLQLDFHSRENLLHHQPEYLNPVFRVFLNKKDYISQTIKDRKWKTGSISSMVTGYPSWEWTRKCAVVDAESQQLLEEFTGSTEPLKAIDKLQEDIMKQRLAIKHKAITDAIDAQMNRVPPIPENFTPWVEEQALLSSRYIVYHYRKGRKQMNGHCTWCGQDVIVTEPRHDKSGTCPSCESTITYKAAGKMRARRWSEWRTVALIQPMLPTTTTKKQDKPEFVVRLFNVCRDFKGDKGILLATSNTKHYEIRRTIHNGTEYETYDWAAFKNTGKVRWCEYSIRGLYERNIDNKTILYPEGISEALHGTPFEYSALEKYAIHRPEFAFNIHQYLAVYVIHREMEYLVKRGLSYYIADCMERGGIGYTPDKFTSLKNDEISLLKQIDGGRDALLFYRRMKHYGMKIVPEQIKRLASMTQCEEDILKIAAHHAGLVKIMNYIEKQTHGKEKTETTFQNWTDYVEVCSKLKYDISNHFILFPRNLEEAHDTTFKRWDVKRKKAEAARERREQKKIAKLYPQIMEKYAMETAKYIITAPESADQLVKEGQELHHCVSNYISRMARKECVILFIRKKEEPDTPFYTMEIAGGKVRQCRGMRNKDTDQEKVIKRLLDKFEKEKLAAPPEKLKEAM